MQELKISARLAYIARCVKKGSVVADIGTDHGYMPIYLIKEHISPKVIAMDVRKGPLQKAKENTELYGVADAVQLRLSDGLAALKKGEADVITISGMGGPLMQTILLTGRDKLDIGMHLILSPQSEIKEFRCFLKQHGFLCVKEHMIDEEGQYYVFMDCVYLGEAYTQAVMEEAYARFGYALLMEKNESLKRFLEREWRINQSLLERMRQLPQTEENVKKRIEELTFDEHCIALARKHYEEA